MTPEFDAKEHGLKGDGKPEREAYSGLLAKVGAAGGGTIAFPAGTYNIKPAVDLTEREREVLQALADDGEIRTSYAKWGWSRPMDVGGHSRSHHSATLERLAKRGLAWRRQRNPRLLLAPSPPAGAKGSWLYRISQAGREVLAACPPPVAAT